MVGDAPSRVNASRVISRLFVGWGGAEGRGGEAGGVWGELGEGGGGGR